MGAIHPGAHGINFFRRFAQSGVADNQKDLPSRSRMLRVVGISCETADSHPDLVQKAEVVGIKSGSGERGGIGASLERRIAEISMPRQKRTC